jgi:hypothetical protein
MGRCVKGEYSEVVDRRNPAWRVCPSACGWNTESPPPYEADRGFDDVAAQPRLLPGSLVDLAIADGEC